MTPIPLYRSPDLRRIEAAAADQPLMQRAGRAAAELAARIRADRPAPVLVLAGPGNNGGDAFVAARHLRERFFETCVVFIGDAGKLPADAADAFARFTQAGGATCLAIPENAHWSLIIDGLFGIGLGRPIAGAYAAQIDRANALAARDTCPLLALDCPSGLDADTGATHGATIVATHTITFIAGKPGLYTGDGPDLCGEISVAPLELDAGAIIAPPALTVGRELFAAHLKPRASNSHKGNYGNAGIVGGAASMVGAALLAGRAALRLGSGRVYLGLLGEEASACDPGQPELMLRRPEKLLASGLTALACGPGLGDSAAAANLLGQACALALPLVLDADALNILAQSPRLHAAVRGRAFPTLLSPHPAEAARLLACGTPAVQADRPAAAIEIAARFNAFVALKGCGTVVAAPDCRWFINTSGNPGLATAGSGDVLTGFVTALLAQGWPPLEALLAAVHVHGAGADRLVAQGIGPIGLAAGELIDSARFCFNEWVYPGEPGRRP